MRSDCRYATVFLFLYCLSTAATASAQERYGMVITGASGGPDFAQNYDRWRAQLVGILVDRLGFVKDHVSALAEKPGPDETAATRENVRQLIERLRERMGKTDLLLIVLIGHGSSDGTGAKFNLVGPDMDAAEWNDLVRTLPGRLVLVNTSSASFPFVQRLSSQNRVLISATNAAAQRYETVFPGLFVEALADTASDVDKNGRTSLWEAFVATSARVKEWYEQRGLLATERPVLDDNGDGAGTLADATGNDGALARRTYLDPEPETAHAGDPVMSELVRRRTALEAEIEDLKGRKGVMSEADYQRELERLLLELATVSKEIRTRQ